MVSIIAMSEKLPTQSHVSLTFVHQIQELYIDKYMAQFAFDWLGGQEQMSPSSVLHFRI
jgi:hypothetical protein